MSQIQERYGYRDGTVRGIYPGWPFGGSIWGNLSPVLYYCFSNARIRSGCVDSDASAMRYAAANPYLLNITRKKRLLWLVGSIPCLTTALTKLYQQRKRHRSNTRYLIIYSYLLQSEWRFCFYAFPTLPAGSVRRSGGIRP